MKESFDKYAPSTWDRDKLVKLAKMHGLSLDAEFGLNYERVRLAGIWFNAQQPTFDSHGFATSYNLEVATGTRIDSGDIFLAAYLLGLADGERKEHNLPSGCFYQQYMIDPHLTFPHPSRFDGQSGAFNSGRFIANPIQFLERYRWMEVPDEKNVFRRMPTVLDTVTKIISPYYRAVQWALPDRLAKNGVSAKQIRALRNWGEYQALLHRLKP